MNLSTLSEFIYTQEEPAGNNPAGLVYAFQIARVEKVGPHQDEGQGEPDRSQGLAAITHGHTQKIRVDQKTGLSHSYHFWGLISWRFMEI